MKRFPLFSSFRDCLFITFIFSKNARLARIAAAVFFWRVQNALVSYVITPGRPYGDAPCGFILILMTNLQFGKSSLAIALLLAVHRCSDVFRNQRPYLLTDGFGILVMPCFR